jgi:prepilin-type N-terminal cleavage/methylation domain-containing protein
MIRREEGFTLVELMITMVVFVLVIAAASSIFSSLLNSFKQQSKIIESNIEGVAGLEMIRVDVQQAGFGIPWFVETNGAQDGLDSWTLNGYLEAAGADNNDPTDPSYYNDGDTPSAVPAPAMQRAPRAILAQNNAGPEMGTGLRSDYLVVKSTSIGLGAAAQKWTNITNNGGVNLPARQWGDTSEDLVNTDRVIVERPVMGGTQQKVLVMAAPPTFSAQFLDVKNNGAWQPDLDSFETHLIFGVDSTTDLRAPFNRADFYVATPDDNMPSKCAPNTGILYKAVMRHADGTFTRYPLLDCVADMQVVFITDENADGNPEWKNADFPFTTTTSTRVIPPVGLIADDIRDQIKGVAVYILAQEGQRDTNFTFNNFSTGCVGVANCIRVGDRDGAILLGREFDLSLIGPDFANYRWKVYKFAVQPPNLKSK